MADALHEVLSAILRAILREIDLDGPIRIGQTGRSLVCFCDSAGRMLLPINLDDKSGGSHNQEDRCSSSETPRGERIRKVRYCRIEIPAYHQSVIHWPPS
jgi:hypothetical protein